jgi:hypothetical protein
MEINFLYAKEESENYDFVADQISFLIDHPDKALDLLPSSPRLLNYARYLLGNFGDGYVT